MWWKHYSYNWWTKLRHALSDNPNKTKVAKFNVNTSRLVVWQSIVNSCDNQLINNQLLLNIHETTVSVWVSILFAPPCTIIWCIAYVWLLLASLVYFTTKQSYNKFVVVVRTPTLKIFSPSTELNPSHLAIQALTANIMKPASYYHVLEISKKSITAKQGLEQMFN